MRVDESLQNDGQPGGQVVSLLLREARKLHRAATSKSLADSLPILRRLLGTQVIRGMTLPELSRQRHTVQRKHVLRALAIEAGYSGWEAYRGALIDMEPDRFQQFDVLRRTAGYPNLWFSSVAAAESYAVEHGGHAIRVGQQAVVLVEMQSPS